MSIEEADEIRLNFGKFMEVANPRLMKLFHADIPLSLLPYPKSKIEEALNMHIEYYQEQNNREAVDAFKSLLPFLDMYVDDKVALSKAYRRLSN